MGVFNSDRIIRSKVKVIYEKFQNPAAASVTVPSMQISLWTLPELSEAIQSPATNPALVPHLEHALNEMMDALFAGQHMVIIINLKNVK